MVIEIKRIYDEFLVQDCYRMLVDRLWPRGISKERASLDEWNKNIAPSTELRKWFGHKPEHFQEFAMLYKEELKNNFKEVKRLQEIASIGKLSLIYAARDPQINHAIILRDFVLENL